MADEVSRFKELKEKLEKLEKEKITLESRIDTLKSEYKIGLETMKTQYGVSTLDEAKNKLSEMKDQIDSKSKEFEEKLNKMELEKDE